MSAVEQRVIALEAEIANAKKAAAKAEEEEAFSEVEQRFTALVSERDELKAKVETLELPSSKATAAGPPLAATVTYPSVVLTARSLSLSPA